MLILRRFIGGIVVALVSVGCFLAAAVMSSAPSVGSARLPDAVDVQAAETLYADLQTMVQTPEPRSQRFAIETARSVQRLIEHAKSDRRADLLLSDAEARLRISTRIASSSWIDATLILRERADGGTPAVGIRIGAFDLPDRLVAALIGLAAEIASEGAGPPPGLEALVPRFAVDPQGVDVTARLPPKSLGVLQLLGGRGGAKFDRDEVYRVYGALLGAQLRSPTKDFAQLVRRAMAGAETGPQISARLVALALMVDGPRGRRLIGIMDISAPCPIEPPEFLLHGRSDLPKHIALSAAITSARDTRLATALGLWKELRDSLPGGSGWSFVDLAADRAGIRLAAAAKGQDWQALRTGLAAVKADQLYPPALLALPEALPDPEFRRRYGGLADRRMRAVTGRIDQLLDGSPVYRGMAAD